jgi:hypothetical protein
MVAMHWRYAAAMVWTIVMLTVRLPACRDCPALEREVAFPSVPYSQQKG